MDKKLAAMLIGAMVTGAAGTKAADALANRVHIHAVQFIVNSDGSVHRNAYGVGDVTRGVLAGTCDDKSAQDRLRAEVAAASAECSFP